jgi:hypothetical protein
VETSDDEPGSTIDPSLGIIVHRYRLTDIGRALPLYIKPLTLPIFTFTMRSTNRVLSLISPEGRGYL